MEFYLAMERTKRLTEDGSYTIYEPRMRVTYHSIYGAVQESHHVFINAGLLPWMEKNIASAELHVLEVGYGTGLNALLTLNAVQDKLCRVFYYAIEPFPLNAVELNGLNYPAVIHRSNLQPAFAQMHQPVWNQPIIISNRFSLFRCLTTVQEFRSDTKFNLIYFDAFAPDVQPELWTTELFQKLAGMMAPEAVLVTYSAKGAVRRALIEAGLRVEKIPGPAHKREMIRATKAEPTSR